MFGREEASEPLFEAMGLCYANQDGPSMSHVTPSVLRPKQITKLCHDHHVYVIMHVMEGVDNIFVTSDDQ